MTGQPTSKPICPSCGAEVPPDAPSGTTAEVAKNQGIDEILITISHCRAYATATAIAVQRGPRVS